MARSSWNADASYLLRAATRMTRAMQHLADHLGEGFVLLQEIVAKQNIPAKFLTVILSEFSRAGLILTHRGKDGGYALALTPVDIRYGACCPCEALRAS